MNEINKSRHSVEKGAERASKAFDRMQDRATTLAEDVKDRAADVLDEIQGYGKESWGGVKSWVRKNPGTALGCALVAGAALSALIVKSSED